MTDTETLAARIDALEMRLTEQDVVIDDLNATITAQWTLIGRLTRQVAGLREQVEKAGTARPPGGAEPPPPHY